MRCDGSCVVDVDGAAGNGRSSVLQERLGELPVTRAQWTGGGRHLLYRANAVLSQSTARLGRPAGVDVRAGDRGYIVATPSVHRTGRRYRWIDPDVSVAMLPAAWLEALRPRNTDLLPPVPRGLAPSQSTAYGEAALRGELERLLRTREGERNESLNLVVFRLAQLAAGSHLSATDIETGAFEVALLIGLEPGESRATIQSGMRAGLQFPRRPRKV